MYTFLLALHNLLRWVILLLLLVNIIRHFAAINRPFAAIDKKLGLWLMIAAHIQLLTGLYEWFAGAWGLKSFVNNGVGAVMKNSADHCCQGHIQKTATRCKETPPLYSLICNCAGVNIGDDTLAGHG